MHVYQVEDIHVQISSTLSLCESNPSDSSTEAKISLKIKRNYKKTKKVSHLHVLPSLYRNKEKRNHLNSFAKKKQSNSYKINTICHNLRAEINKSKNMQVDVKQNPGVKEKLLNLSCPSCVRINKGNLNYWRCLFG